MNMWGKAILTIGVAMLTVAAYAWLTRPDDLVFAPPVPSEATRRLERLILIQGDYIGRLDDALAWFEKVAGIKVVVDWSDLKNASIRPDERIRLTGKWRAGSMLMKILEEAERSARARMKPSGKPDDSDTLDYCVQGDAVLIQRWQTLANGPGRGVLRMHDVRDLVAEHAAFHDLMVRVDPLEEAPTVARSPYLRPSHAVANLLGFTYLGAGHALFSNDVNSECWGGRLVVYETPEVHQQIEHFLTLLRLSRAADFAADQDTGGKQ